MLDKQGVSWYSISVPETAGSSPFANISPAEDKHTDIFDCMSLSLDKDFFFMEVKPTNAE